MMLDGAEECQLSGPIGELVPFTLPRSPATCSRRLLLVKPVTAWATRPSAPAGAMAR
jgi:hypothetical protein